MIKISFKNKKKEVNRMFNRVTEVWLKGTLITSPGLIIPDCVLKKLCTMGSTAYLAMGLSEATICFNGISIKASQDEDNPQLGERLAEARAKIKMYKFLKRLCSELSKYYLKTLVGSSTQNLLITENGSLMHDAIKYDLFLKREKEHLNKLLKSC